MEFIEINPQEKKYTAVKSEFIKGKIRGSNWNDHFRRAYIDDLIKLENYVLHGARGWANAMSMHGLTDRYRREYDMIFKELRPKEYQRLIEEEKQRELKRKEESEEECKKLRAKQERQRREWLEAGGTEH